MAKARAFVSIDMTDFSTTVGRTVRADEDTLVVRAGRADTYYFGDFTYPNGEWKGTITGVSIFLRGEEQWMVRGIDLPTRFATVGIDLQSAYRRALSEDDVLVGSNEDDKLASYAGDDRVSAAAGDDFVFAGSAMIFSLEEAVRMS